MNYYKISLRVFCFIFSYKKTRGISNIGGEITVCRVATILVNEFVLPISFGILLYFVSDIKAAESFSSVKKLNSHFFVMCY